MVDNYTFEKGINEITKRLDYIIQQNTDHIIQTERLIEEIKGTEEYEEEENTKKEPKEKPEITATKNNNDKITQERR